MKKICLSVALLTVVFLGGLSPANAQPLTWEDCVAMAKKRNPDLVSSERALDASISQYRGSFNGVSPHLSLSGNYSDGSNVGSKSVSTLSNGNVVTTSSSGGLWQAGATASLDLLNVSKIADIKTAAANRESARANVEIASANLLNSLKKAFAGLLYTQEAVNVLERINNIWTQSAEMVSLRYDSGRESKGNTMKIQAQSLQAQADLAQAKRDLRVAQQALGQALGMDDFTALSATGSFSVSTASEFPANMAALAEQTPRIRLQKSILSQIRASLVSAKSSLFPTLSASYTRSVQDTNFFPSQGGWSWLGLLNIPIFGNGPTATYFSISTAERNLEKAGEDLKSIFHQVRTDLETTWSALAQSQDQVKVQRAFLEADRQRKAEADIRYQNGLMSFENWEPIVIELVGFEKSFLRSERDVVNAEADWNKAQGKGL